MNYYKVIFLSFCSIVSFSFYINYTFASSNSSPTAVQGTEGEVGQKGTFRLNDEIEISYSHTSNNPADVEYWVNEAKNRNLTAEELFQMVSDSANTHGVGTVSSNGVVCSNGLEMSINTRNSSSNGSRTPPPTPPPPEPPSCRYTASWTERWSDCKISSNWTNEGKISCKQETIYTRVRKTLPRRNCPKDRKKPSKKTNIKTFSMDISNPITIANNDNVFADNNGTHKIRVNISGTTNEGKPVIGLVGTKYAKISDISDVSGLKANRTNNTGDNALNFGEVSSTDIHGSGNNFYFEISKIKSFAPLKTGSGKIKLKLNGTEITLDNVNYNFKKPYTGIIKVFDIDKNNREGKVDIGTTNILKLISSGSLAVSNFKVEDFSSKLNVGTNDISIVSSTVSGSTLDKKDGVIFYSTLNTSKTASQIKQNPILKIDKPIISYDFGGKKVSYYLTNSTDPLSTTPLMTNYGKSFIGVKILGVSQVIGKQQELGKDINFSAIDMGDARSKIRKNAFMFTKSIPSNTIVNGVYYFEGNKKISEIDLNGVQTIVIKDGHLVIDEDISNFIGIIVLKDNYKVGRDSNEGNIYITPNVKNISAIIYADGGIMSANSFGVALKSNNEERSSLLREQLVLKGALFTRNTIYGGILTGGEYLLPGNIYTNDFESAMIYDLNYIRRGNVGCDKNQNGNCTDTGEHSESFIIEYNSAIKENPPALFESF